MPTQELSIGSLAAATGCKIPTIRYYEKIGLMPEPRRSGGNTRIYGTVHLARLGFIKHCRELGFSQTTIRELLRLTESPAQSCEAVDEIARTHLQDVNRRIEQLNALKAELERMIENCQGGFIKECRIIHTLGDYSHQRCLNDRHALVD